MMTPRESVHFALDEWLDAIEICVARATGPLETYRGAIAMADGAHTFFDAAMKSYRDGLVKERDSSPSALRN